MSSAQMELLLETMPDAVLVVTDAGGVRYVNEAAVELFGRPRQDLLGEQIAFSVKDGEPSEISISRRGETRLCEMRVVRFDWAGEPGHIASIRDRTDRVRAEEMRRRALALEAENARIQAASRLKTEFLANMSHELRTPLNAIIGFAQLLFDREVTPDATEYEEFLGDILANGKHLLRLISEILDLTKIEAGKLDLRPERVSFAHLAAEAIAMARPGIEKSRHLLEMDIDPSIGHVWVDPTRLRQLLHNYLSNAIKFTPAGGRITLRARREGPEHFRVEVEDTGIGIAPEDLPRLFVDFQQLDTGAAKRHQGTGLGLAITRRLVEAMGGSVGVSSQPACGSVFYAILPVGAAPR